MLRFFHLKWLILTSLFQASMLCGQAEPASTFTIAIPKNRPVTSSQPLSNMTRDTLIYMISSFLNPSIGKMTIVSGTQEHKGDWVQVSRLAPHKEALESFKNAEAAKDPMTSYRFFKELIKTAAYLSSRDWHHPNFPIPNQLSDFEKSFPFHRWETEIIEKSVVKGSQRIIYRNPPSAPPISVAQTVDPITQKVRETEIIIEREELSGQFDFYAYNAQGELALTSMFRTLKETDVEAPVPLSCLACHYNGNQGRFQRAPSSFSRH